MNRFKYALIKNCLIVVLSAVFVSYAAGRADAEGKRPPPNIDYNTAYAPGEFIVKLKADSPQKRINEICLSAEIPQIKKAILRKRMYLLKVPPHKSVRETIDNLYQKDGIAEISPNYQLRPCAVPNDTYYSNSGLYGLRKIEAPGAWDTITDASSITVAVLDAGVDYYNPDLIDNIWINDDPLDGVDNDGNGYVDDLLGWDFVYDDNAPLQVDAYSHGTACAGIIGASGNNGGGITGVSWNVKIMPVLIADSSGTAYTFDVCQGIEYAINNGAKIINFSYGGSAYNTLIEEYIADARDAGVLFVTAAGNDNKNTDISPEYPASFDIENIISVGATDSSDNLASFSNYGNSVDIAAPGDSVLSTIWAYDLSDIDNPNNYGLVSGTSFSAPYVAGACALVWANDPGLTYLEVKNKILNGADNLTSLDGLIREGRRLNVNNALTYIPPKNLALTAVVTASSEYNSNYRAEMANDGVYGLWDSNEWASNGEMTPWIRFKWPAAQSVNKIILYDRCNQYDQILDAWMYLKSGGAALKSIHLGMLPYGGGAKEVVLDHTYDVDEIYIDITSGKGLNVGLSEMQVYNCPDVNKENVADECYSVSASSYYSDGYAPEMAKDEIYGLWDANEWASNGEMTPWIRFKWPAAQAVNKIILYDRCNQYDQILDAWMYLKTGGAALKSIHLGMLPYGGGAREIVLDHTYNVDEIYLDVAGGQGINIGLSELLAFNNSDINEGNLVKACSAVTASSYYNRGYRPDMAVDGVYGMWDSNEWASNGEGAGAWIRLDWDTPQNMTKVVLYDRCNPYDQITDAWLLIRDSGGGTTAKHIGMFPYGGAAKEIVLTETEGTNVVAVQVYISGVAESTQNVGLSEIMCF